MGSWPGEISAITLFVEDLEATKQFYREVFGLPVAFEDDDSAVFKFKNTLINLLKSHGRARAHRTCLGGTSRGRIPPPAHHRGG